MERESTFSVPEILGVATAGAAALGGIIVALGRAQAHAARERAATLGTLPGVQDASAGVDRGRDAIQTATDRLIESWPAMSEQAQQLKTRLADLSHAATDRVVGAASSGGEQTRAAGADVMERINESVIPGVVAMLSSVRETTGGAAAQTEGVVGSMTSSAGHAAERAVEVSTNVARETFATLFWLAAASALVYFALLSPERRERVKRLLYGGLEQAQLLMRDFQGYEEDV